MSEVFKPEKLARKRKDRIPDVFPKPTEPQRPPLPLTPEDLSREIKEIKEKLEKIKQALKKHGILIE